VELPVAKLVAEREGVAALVPFERRVDDDQRVVEPRRAEHVGLAELLAQVVHLEREPEDALGDRVDGDRRSRRLALPLGVLAQQLLSGALELRVGAGTGP
jgi:hypothetical protein